MRLDSIMAFLFLLALAAIYLVVPIVLAHYLWTRKFMSDRIRYAFASVLIFNVILIIFFVILDLLA
jgi:hypothetical protein